MHQYIINNQNQCLIQGFVLFLLLSCTFSNTIHYTYTLYKHYYTMGLLVLKHQSEHKLIIELHFFKHFIDIYISKKLLCFCYLSHRLNTPHLSSSFSFSLFLSHSYSVIFRLISEVMHFLQIKEEASPPPTTFAQSPSLTPPPFPPGR